MANQWNEQDHAVVTSWWNGMMKHAANNKKEEPNYYAHQPETLITTSNVGSFLVGNGDDVYAHLQRSIETAQTEVILITCFWARSKCLDMVAASLKRLSDQVIQEQRQQVRVFIGFSSLSIFQKLFQTSSLNGRAYPPSEWPTKLCLPPSSELPGLDLHVKSIFLRPFSVMHPKFVIIDRKLAWLPSCNVSWESWLEGCIPLSGPVVKKFVDFYEHFWLRDNSQCWGNGAAPSSEASIGDTLNASLGAACGSINFEGKLFSLYTVFLPSPHHKNPRLRPWPWIQAHPPPPTPLNHFILSLFTSASTCIYIQTPNLTAPPVLTALLSALGRGVSIHIVTSERLMILEQLVTAGTTTTRCVKKLIKRYNRIRSQPSICDEESGPQPRLGELRIDYFIPKEDRRNGEPLQSHLKLTIVDQQWTVLGSGNMDRASWFTSQELGVAFHSNLLARNIKDLVDQQLVGRKKRVYDISTR